MNISKIIFDKNIHKEIMDNINYGNNIVEFTNSYINKFYNSLENKDISYDEFKKKFLLYLSSNREDIEEISNKIKNSSEKLSDNINSAKEAIVKQDNEKLSVILEELNKMRKELEELNSELYTDELTKCYNRKYLKKILDNDRFISNGSFAIIDFDKFKYINDTFGHVTGDKVLITISKVINSSIKQHMDRNTRLIRYGGDEFFIIHYGTNGNKLDKLLDSIQNKLAKMNFTESSKNIKFKTNFSYGITDFVSGDKFQKVLEKSDVELYKQKEERKKLGLR